MFTEHLLCSGARSTDSDPPLKLQEERPLLDNQGSRGPGWGGGWRGIKDRADQNHGLTKESRHSLPKGQGRLLRAKWRTRSLPACLACLLPGVRPPPSPCASPQQCSWCPRLGPEVNSSEYIEWLLFQELKPPFPNCLPSKYCFTHQKPRGER